MNKKVIFVFGTRPEAIKMAPVVLNFQESDDFDVKVLVTAQHRDMLDQVLAIFGINPDIDLNLMKPGQNLAGLSSAVLSGVTNVLTDEKPDMIFVHGDTTTSAMSALAAYYQKIPVAHIEAGLRTFDKYSPFPEEINRQITGRISELHLAPTKGARNNLLKENISEETICITGNTVIDALFWVLSKLKADKRTFAELDQIDFSKKIILITGHRRENFGDKFIEMCQAMKEIANNYPDTVELVYPVHLNPNVQKPVNEILSTIPNVKLLEPLSYEPFVNLMEKSHLILTDSGGIQEEAPSLGKPVLVMRDTTERPEAVEAGTVKLVGSERSVIVSEVIALLDDSGIYNNMSRAMNPYGDGNASERILKNVKSYFRNI